MIANCIYGAIIPGRLAVEFTGSKSNRDPRYGLISIARSSPCDGDASPAQIGRDSSPWPFGAGKEGNPLTRVICRNLPQLFRKHFGARLCDATPGDSFVGAFASIGSCCTNAPQKVVNSAVTLNGDVAIRVSPPLPRNAETSANSSPASDFSARTSTIVRYCLS